MKLSSRITEIDQDTLCFKILSGDFLVDRKQIEHPARCGVCNEPILIGVNHNSGKKCAFLFSYFKLFGTACVHSTSLEHRLAEEGARYKFIKECPRCSFLPEDHRTELVFSKGNKKRFDLKQVCMNPLCEWSATIAFNQFNCATNFDFDAGIVYRALAKRTQSPIFKLMVIHENVNQNL